MFCRKSSKVALTLATLLVVLLLQAAPAWSQVNCTTTSMPGLGGPQFNTSCYGPSLQPSQRRGGLDPSLILQQRYFTPEPLNLTDAIEQGNRLRLQRLQIEELEAQQRARRQR